MDRQRLIKWIQYGAIPVLMVVVICVQLYSVQTAQLSRWRGGGFGMYSEYHPNTRHFWLTPPDKEAATLVVNHRKKHRQVCPLLETIVSDCRRQADNRCRYRMISCLNVLAPKGTVIRGYRPSFDPTQKTLNRQEFVSWPYPKSTSR